MSENLAGMKRKIDGATDLRSVVRTMKAVAAANILQYEKSVRSLEGYYQTVELGMSACLKKRSGTRQDAVLLNRKRTGDFHAVIFGSDQGLVGQFNDRIVGYATQAIASATVKPKIWAVGERVYGRLLSAGLHPERLFPLPSSVGAITPLVSEILIAADSVHSAGEYSELEIFYNHPTTANEYAPVSERVLPFDEKWQSRLKGLPWPAKRTPEILGKPDTALGGLIREYLFVSLFRACADSLASENASRLVAMQRADKNIEDLLKDLNEKYRRSRQMIIDEELFDVLSGFESVKGVSR